MKIFSYGTLIVPEMTQKYFKKTFIPEKSVFIKGFNLLVEHANSEKYPNYHYIKCNFTNNEKDIIPGFIIDIPDDFIEKIDRWEGEGYVRKEIICYTRELEEIKCFIYLAA